MDFSKMTLENSTYHWFWGLRFKKGHEKSLRVDLAEWQQMGVGEDSAQFIGRINQEVQAYRSRFFLIRFFIYWFNYPTLQKKMLYLEHFCNPSEESTPMSHVPPSSEEKGLPRARFSPKKQPPLQSVPRSGGDDLTEEKAGHGNNGPSSDGPAYSKDEAVQADSYSARDKVSIPIDFLKDNSVSIQMVQRVLGLLRFESRATYTLKEVKRAWRGQAADLHPDKHVGSSEPVKVATAKEFKTARAFYDYLLAHGELYLARHSGMGDLVEAEKAWEGVQQLAVQYSETGYQRAVREMDELYAQQEAIRKKLAKVNESLDRTEKNLDRTEKNLDRTEKNLDRAKKDIERVQASVEAFQSDRIKRDEALRQDCLSEFRKMLAEEDLEYVSERDGRLGQEEKRVEPVVEQRVAAAVSPPVTSERDTLVAGETGVLTSVFSYFARKTQSLVSYPLSFFSSKAPSAVNGEEPRPVAPALSGNVSSDIVRPSHAALSSPSSTVSSCESLFPILNSSATLAAKGRSDSKRSPSSGKTEPESSITHRKPGRADPDGLTEDSMVASKNSPKNKVKF